MDIRACATGKAFEEIKHQFRLQIAYSRCPDLGIDHGGNASPEIDGRQAESFVHGHEEITGAQDAAAIAQSTVEYFAQGDPNILHGVVLIDIQVARGCQFQIESAMARKEFKHMVKKTDSSGNFILPTTLNRERNPNLGFRGLAVQLSFPHALTSLDSLSFPTTSRSAPIRIRVGSYDPRVSRTQPSHPGSALRSRTRIPRVRKA